MKNLRQDIVTKLHMKTNWKFPEQASLSPVHEIVLAIPTNLDQFAMQLNNFAE